MQTKDEVLIALQRMAIGKDENHPNWYEGMYEDAVAELEALAKCNERANSHRLTCRKGVRNANNQDSL